ncbi:MAG: hypothetical protein JO089_03640 [Alphaproteobacteria bacterium]|nr:hypothetical protein [Alphaproteobacteria bacterium]
MSSGNTINTDDTFAMVGINDAIESIGKAENMVPSGQKGPLDDATPDNPKDKYFLHREGDKVTAYMVVPGMEDTSRETKRYIRLDGTIDKSNNINFTRITLPGRETQEIALENRTQIPLGTMDANTFHLTTGAGDAFHAWMVEVAQDAGGLVNTDTFKKLKTAASNLAFKIPGEKAFMSVGNGNAASVTVDIEGFPVTFEGETQTKDDKYTGMTVKKVMGKEVTPFTINLNSGSGSRFDLSDTEINGKLTTAFRQSLGMVNAGDIKDAAGMVGVPLPNLSPPDKQPGVPEKK